MLPGTYHAMWMVNILPLGPRSTVMSGSYFMSQYTMDQSLYAAILHTFWHDLWTNATHDDRDYTIVRMLAWQYYLMPTHNGPFKGRSLYALLIFSRLHSLLRSLPWKKSCGREPLWLECFVPEGSQPLHLEGFPAHKLLHEVRGYMVELCDRVRGAMTAEQGEEFDRFYDICAYYESESNARAKYNRTQNNSRSQQTS